MIKRIYIITVAIVCIILFSTCRERENAVIEVTNIDISHNALLLSIGDTITLTAKVLPVEATDKTVSWESDNPIVATVSTMGLVTAISNGKAIITVKTLDANKTAKCTVFVSLDSTFRIVQWCDPQLGYYVDYQTCVAQAERAVQIINEIAPDLLLICGDMIHDHDDDTQFYDFLRIISPVNVPIIMTPGNHDLPYPVTTEGLDHYRSFFGDDFQTVEVKGFMVMIVNSQLLYYQQEVPSEEYFRHLSRVNRALENAKSKDMPIIVMSHQPPYDLPEMQKQYILSGTFLWLSGHWHIPWRYTYNYPFGSMVILVGESTSYNSGGYPLGIRLLTIHSDHSFHWDFIPLY